ncbi:YbjQ family protein [Maribrevibacterium harenarium]|uniref:YbjQ family protein n=1 Tax=Maribrevibacterium harenarium TaxID=2589817 RepID=A0A501X141_9GAMM|nr:heavy metal-binding domain-containing protein [Maribrevibacterium harenarium]TPE54111.1 YbjQ family protein [Maribrevibacterium harenarium]
MKTLCPHCGSEIKSTLFSNNQLISEAQTKLINYHNKTSVDGYCKSCSEDLLLEASEAVRHKSKELNEEIKNLISNIPVLTSHHPYKWEYDSIGIVTGQSTTGTGVITEFTSGFTDFFGSQSGRTNSKLVQGENLCLDQIRAKTLSLGGNAVVAADIDYAEVGGNRGMLMVCMSGTAVKLHDLDVLGEGKKSQLERLSKLVDEIKSVGSILDAYYGDD